MCYPGETSYESDIIFMLERFADAFKAGTKYADNHPAKKQSIEEINALIKELQPNEGQVSDGYHTFDELYDFRREYNAALVNTHIYPCHKSLRHSDGELCFGGGWFIVMVNLPTGQISNHYEIKYWDEFNCEERECAEPWDGHTEKDVLARLSDLNLNNSAKKQTVTIDAWVARDDNNLISLYEEKPSKKVSFYVGRFWALLREEDFPSVTFENSPKKVKVTIELEEEV